jgi:hypothetical protein
MMPAMGRHGGSKKQRTSGFRRRGWTVEAFPVPGDPEVSAASVELVMGALEDLGEELPWSAVADRVVPLFQRIRPYPPGYPEPVRRMLPSGVSVTYGVDSGPAFIHVTPELLDRWGTTIDMVADLALANLRRRAAGLSARAVVNDSIEEVPVGALQSGSGCASTFVLLPEELPRLFGRNRALFIAPMRDLLIALPPDTEPGVAAWIHLEFASQDPNCLAPIGFRLADGRVTAEALDEPAAIA